MTTMFLVQGEQIDGNTYVRGLFETKEIAEKAVEYLNELYVDVLFDVYDIEVQTVFEKDL